MKRKTKIIALIAIFIVIVTGIVIANISKSQKVNDKKGEYRILTSFYPIYIMTLNITNGASNVKVENMAESLTGCIHDYTLTTSDLRKFENCDVFVENGAGLEEFTDEITSKYSNVKIVDAADLVNDLLIDEEGETNSHIWLSLDIYINEVNKITQELSDLNSVNAQIYKRNSDNYIKKLVELKRKFDSLTLEGKKAICLNESLEYLLRDNKMDITMVETDHEQASISAKTVKDLIEKMKNENIKTIFIDKDDNRKNAEMLANETGASICVLNSEMNGDKELNAYIKAMEENLKTLEQIREWEIFLRTLT